LNELEFRPENPNFKGKSISMKKSLLFASAIVLLNFTSAFSQDYKLSLNDSLTGFDETSVKAEAPYRGVTLEEMSFYLAAQRRDFIKQKYHLKSANEPAFDYSLLAKTAAAACVNEDFEEGSLTSAVPGTIVVTSTNQINGWTAWGSNNSGAGINGNCTNTYSYSNPTVVQLIAPGAAGLTDAIIGSGYRIYSVFGDTTIKYPNAALQDAFNHYGDWFAKINNQIAGASVNRLTKTINVTPSNVYFNFAVLLVMEGSHGCCDGGAVSIVFKDCLGNMLATAQQYSIAQGTACATSSSISILTSTVNPSWKYSPWSNSSIDLTPWMGQCVVAEFTAFDCIYTGHAGYAYVDAQCAPVVVNGINTPANYAYYKIYPNPSAGYFNLDISKGISECENVVRNVLRQIVLKQNVIQGENSIKTEDLAKGIYNYSVMQNKVVVSVGKVVVE